MKLTPLRRNKRAIFLISTTFLFLIFSISGLFLNVDETEAAPQPSVSISLPGETFIGEDFSFSVTFDNDGTDEGYGPFIDLIFPVTGVDGIFPFDPGFEEDGITFNSATYLGANVYSQTFEFPDDGLGTGCVSHPYALDNTGSPVDVCGTAGDVLIVLEMPFGSFTVGQPAATVDISASLSDLVDIPSSIPIEVRGGFRFGEDPLNNPNTDPSILDPFSTANTSPTILSLSKSYVGPESETATGPNFPRRYRVTVDIADGQTVDNIVLTDKLPNNEEYLSIQTLTPGTCSVTAPPSSPGPQNPPDNELTIGCTSVTGGSSGNDIVLDFNFFVTYEDADSNNVIYPNTGDDVTSVNDAAVTGDWTPNDIRDALSVVSSDESTNDHTLTDKSIAIQKGASIVSDIGATGASPGDTIQYTMNFQISDFFVFEDIIVDDVISDGHRVNGTYTPTLSLTEHGTTLSGNFDSANYTVTPNYTPADTAPNDGTTAIEFRVSDELVTRLADGRVFGGCIPQTGTSSPDCDTFNSGGTTATITFQTIIQENYSDDFLSGDPSVDHGDEVSNSVTITGDVVGNDTLTPTGSSESDGSGSTTQIVRGGLTKEIYALKGNTAFTPPVQVASGDEVTYRLQYTLPSSDFENLLFEDFLPLPTFKVDDPDGDGSVGPSWTFDSTSPSDVGYTSAPPAPGVVKFGPADTFYDKSEDVLGTGIVPAISLDVPSNMFDFTFGDFDDPASESSVIDIMFTVVATDNPLANGLFLTNQIRSNEGSTIGVSEVADSIVQVEITQPELHITKGIVSTDNATAIFDPVTPAPVTFTAPGSGCSRFTGTVSSGSLATTPIDSNISDIDGGDLVTFAILIENTGDGPNGAFDVRFRDSVPAGYTIPGSGINLCVTDGTGIPVGFTAVDGTDTNPILEDGIEITDPGVTVTPEGGIDPYDPSNGRNIIIATYDLEVASTVEPLEEIENTATMFRYAGLEGGVNHIGEHTDTATGTIIAPEIDKTIVTTDQAHTSGNDVVIGEIVTYQVDVTIPEGMSTLAIVDDSLDSGLAFIDCNSISASSGLSTSVGTFADVCSGVTVTSSGQDMEFDFGTITNSNNSVADEIITIEYDVAVLNQSGNNAGTNRNNDATFTWSLDSISDSAPNVTIREPVLQVNKSVSPAAADAGDSVSYSFTVSHTGSSGADAFDVSIEDIIPSDLSYVPASFTQSCSGGALGVSISDAGVPTLTGTIDELPLGASCQFDYDVTLNVTVETGQTIDNTAEVQWTSIPGDLTTPTSTHSSVSTERTGDATDPGAAQNDYVTTDDATLTIFGSEPDKSLVTTSESHTGNAGNERVAIGEVIRYRITSRIAEGTTPDFQLRDRVPNGLQFLNDGTATVAFVSDGAGISSSTLIPATISCDGGANPDLSLSGDESSISSVVTECVLPDSAVSTSPSSNNDSYNSGTDVYFKLGDLVNADSDSDKEYVVVEFNLLTLNVSGNQSGTNLNNRFQAYVDGSSINSNSSALNVTIAEPNVGISKILTTTPVDAGDPIAYQIIASNNASGSNAATAFEVNITDTIDANINISSVTPSTSGSGSITNSTSGNDIDIAVSELAPGETFTVLVSGDVDNATAVGSTIPNTADVVYTSLPGGSGTTSNPTGSSTPGASGDGDGERDGSGGTNDYSASGDADVTLATATPLKALQTTSESHTSGSNVTIGEEATYEIDVTLADGTVNSLVVIDNVPTGTQYTGTFSIDDASFGGTVPTPTVSSSGGNGDDVTFTFSSFSVPVDGNPSNNTFTIILDLLVLDVPGNVGLNPGQTTLTNQASINANGAGAVNTNTVDVTVVEPDMDITKSVSPTSAPVNGSVTYTLVISNDGTSDAFEVNFEDVLPSDVTFDGNLTNDAGEVPDTLSESSGTISASWLVFPEGGSSTISFDATINTGLSQGDTIVNTGTVTQATTISGTNTNERDEPDVDDTATITITAPDLSITKTDSKTTTNPGEVNAYVLTVENVGDSIATGVEITETVPDHTTFVPGLSTAGWSCLPNNSAGSTCTLAAGSLVPTASTNATFAVQVDNNFASGIDQIVNNASVSDDGTNGTDPDLSNNSTSDTDTLSAEPDLTISKDDSGITAEPGDTVSYALNYENVGDQDATGVSITDTVPDHSTFNSGTSTTGWSCSPNNNAGSTCTFTIGNLNIGASGSVVFAVDVDDPIAAGVDEIDNTASIADDGSNGSDPTPANNTDSDNTPITATPDLTVTKDDGGITSFPTGTITYTIHYENVGNQGAIGVTLTETVPVETSFNSGASTSGWSCSPNNNAGSTCTYTIGALAAGNSGSVNFAVTVNSSVSSGFDTVNNTVSTSDDGTNGPDPTPGDNQDNDDTPITAAPDLQITKDDGGTVAYDGDTVTYALNYGNVGTQNATGVVVTETVPDYTTFNPGASTSGWICSPDNTEGSTCTYTVGPLNVGATGSVNFAVTIDDPLDNSITEIDNTTSITDDGSNGADLNPIDNLSSDDTPISQVIDLSITKDDGETAVDPGDTLIYVQSIANLGNVTATGVEITETVPDYTTFTSASSTSGWVCTPDNTAGSTCTYSYGTLAAGDADVVNFAVTVDSTLPGGANSIDNTASIADDGSAGADFDPSNNTTSDSDVLGGVPDLYIVKSDGTGDTTFDALLTYTLDYGNIGPQTATGTVITETVPINTTFNPGNSTAGWSCAPDNTAGSTCTITVGSVAPGDTSSVTFAVDTDPYPPVYDEIDNTATIADDGLNGPEPDLTNNTSSTTTPVLYTNVFDPPSAKKTVNDAGLPELEWKMVWINDGNITAIDVRITDDIPVGTTYVDTSFTCDARGASTTTTCIFDPVEQEVVWVGEIAPDPGGTDEDDSLNEVVLIFKTTVPLDIASVENRACAHWDDNDDGDIDDDVLAGQTPSCSDDPDTPPGNDPTVWTNIYLPATGSNQVRNILVGVMVIFAVLLILNLSRIKPYAIKLYRVVKIDETNTQADAVQEVRKSVRRRRVRR